MKRVVVSRLFPGGLDNANHQNIDEKIRQIEENFVVSRLFCDFLVTQIIKISTKNSLK